RLRLVEAEAEDVERHPWVRGRDREHDRRAVTRVLRELPSLLGIEACGHEDRAAARVEVEHLRRVGREQETVIDSPLAHCVAAALQDREVERVDLRLLQYFDAVRPMARVGHQRGLLERRRRDLTLEPLQGPAAAALDLGRNARQRDDRADLFALTGELE